MAVVLHIYPPGGSIGQNVCCGGSTEIIKTLIFVHFEVRNTYSIIIIILLIYCYYYYRFLFCVFSKIRQRVLTFHSVRISRCLAL